MADEPVIIGRGAAAQEFPSDIPEQLPKYPGKALAHRYLPTQQPRLVEQPKGAGLAINMPFKPIASFTHLDKNIHLGPVSNVRTRGLQPVAIDGKVNLPTREGQAFDVSEELRGPLQVRVNRLTAFGQEDVPPPDLAVPTTASAKSATVPLVAPTGQPHLTELERLKAAAIEELAKRASTSPPPERPIEISAVTAPPEEASTILPKPPVEGRTATAPQVTEVQELSGGAGDNAARLISEAERLETELTETLKQLSAEQKTAKAAPTERGKEDEYLAQISQLVADRTQLLKQVNDLTAATKEAQAKREGAETKLEEATKEFNRQIQSLKIEKTNLSAQVKTLEEKLEELQKKQEIIKETSNQVADLKTRLSSVEKERDAAKEQVVKLQSLLMQMQKSVPTSTTQAVPKKVVEPKAVEPSKEAEAKIRIVKPQTAVGKMAPSLTSAPNVINGIVKDAAGYLLSNVIIVVKDKAGEPVRALKTNKIGQFAISTPLPNGTYIMELEAEGHNFDAVQVELEGKLLPPLEIRAND